MNITNHFDNMTSVKGFLGIANNTTGGWFWIGMLFLIFGVLTIAFIGFGFEVAIVTSAFIVLIAGMFLVYLELVAWQWLMMFLGIILFTYLYIIWSRRKYT